MATFAFDDPALSFSKQPALASLFEAVVKLPQPVTLICGAGVSIDGSLPSWYDLVSGMCDQLPNDLASLVKADSVDLTRKVDYIVRLAQLQDPGTSVEDLVRRALYGSTKVLLPGSLALAVGALSYELAGRLRLVTTNFDDPIEAGLEARYLQSNVHSKRLSRNSSQRDHQLAGSVRRGSSNLE